MTFFARHRAPRVASVVAGGALAASVVLAPVASHAAVANNPSQPLLIANPVAQTVQQLGANGVYDAVVGASVLNGQNTGLNTGLRPGIDQDAQGNIYVTNGTSLVKVSALNHTPVAVPVTGLNNLVGVAVDGANDLYLIDHPVSGVDSLWRLASGSSTPTQLTPSGLSGSVTALASDTAGHVYVADAAGHVLEYGTTGAYVGQVLATGLVNIKSMSVAGSGIYLLNVGGTPTTNVVKEFDPSTGTPNVPVSVLGGTGSNVRLLAPNAITVDRSLNVYVADFGVGLLEFPTGTSTWRYIDTTGIPGTSQLLADRSSSDSSTTTTTTHVTTYSSAHFRVKSTTRRAGKRHAWVRAYGLLPGETYTVRFGAKVVGHGIASGSGTVRTRIKLPRCFGGWRWVRVTGYNSGRTGAVKLPVKRSASCHR